MSVERPFLQANYESLHLNFRHARQMLDQELRAIKAELANTKGQLSEAQATYLHDRVLELRRKLEESQRTHLWYSQTLKVRTENVSFVNDALERNDLSQATEERIPALVASYLADTGRFPRTVQALTECEPQLKDLVDWDIIREENDFVDTVVHKKNYDRGLKWCRQNRTFLTKNGIDLEFKLQMLQYQHLLVDKGDVLAAIAYARRAFAKAGPTKDFILMRAAGALYGPVKIHANKPAVLSNPLEEEDDDAGSAAALEEAIRSAFRSVHGRGAAYMLLSRVGIGLAALKTRQCGKLPHPPGYEKCPACSPMNQAIADQVPYAMHTTSILDDDVSALPNNNVIGRKRLKEYTRQAWPEQASKGQVVDPETNEVFSEDELKQVYAL